VIGIDIGNGISAAWKQSILLQQLQQEHGAILLVLRDDFQRHDDYSLRA
jgi:hypothetical protein